jgi:hypothetical protein
MCGSFSEKSGASLEKRHYRSEAGRGRRKERNAKRRRSSKGEALEKHRRRAGGGRSVTIVNLRRGDSGQEKGMSREKRHSLVLLQRRCAIFSMLLVVHPATSPKTQHQYQY